MCAQGAQPREGDKLKWSPREVQNPLETNKRERRYNSCNGEENP